jgi:hypothetical protein
MEWMQTIIVINTILVSHNEVVFIFIILNHTLPLCSSIFCGDASRVESVFIIFGRLGIANGFLLGLERI